MADNTSTFIELTASIVSAYVSNNSVLFDRFTRTDRPSALGSGTRIQRTSRDPAQTR